MTRGAALAVALAGSAVAASVARAAPEDGIAATLVWHHVQARDGTGAVVDGALGLGRRITLDGEAGVIVTDAGTSLRNARVGVATPLATAGRPVLRVSLVVPLAAQRGALASDLGTLAAAVPVDDRALRPGLWALTVDGRWRWRWARRWLAIDAAAELRGAGATSPGGRLPLRAALGGGVVAFGHLELGATLHTAAALLASAPSGEAFVHALSLDAALPLGAWRVGAAVQVPVDASARDRDALVVAATAGWGGAPR